MRSKADVSQLNLAQGTKNKNRKKTRKRNYKQKQIRSEDSLAEFNGWQEGSGGEGRGRQRKEEILPPSSSKSWVRHRSLCVCVCLNV